MSVEEVFTEIEKDSIFYEESGGGVTLSGGEPLAQPEFLIKLLTLCKKEGIHTTLDTCGYAKQELIMRVIDLVDLYLYDLKHMDDEKHLKYVGVSNKPILKNLKLLKEKNVIVRFPLIPKINDNVKNIQEMGDFLSNNGFKEVNILPYHKAGSEKIPRLNRPSEVYTFESPDEENLDKIKKILDEFGLKVKIGG
jgi:pyruvate formate lyase activating enzyme